MAGVNISNVGLTFVDQMTNDIVESLNMESDMRQLVATDERWTGDYKEGRVHVRPSGAIQNVEDGGAFPVPNKQSYVPYKVYRKFVAGAIQLTDGAMAAAAKGKNVARDVISSETEGLMQEILKYENGMFTRNGDGSVGSLLDSRLQTAHSGTTSEDVTVTDARMLWEGVEYDIYDTTLTTYRGSTKVLSVEPTLTSGNFRVNFTGQVASSVATDKIVWKNSVNRALTGLDALIEDSGTFQDINTATYPRYTSLVMDNGGTLRELTPSLFRQMLAGLKQKSGNRKPAQGLKVLTNTWGAINVEELYEGELRIAPDTKVAGMAIASFQSTLGKVDIIHSTDAIYNTMFFGDFSQIKRAVQKPLAWRREGGGIFKRSDVAGYYTATCLEICDFYIKERHTSGKIQDLREDYVTAY